MNNAQECLNLLEKELLNGSYVNYPEDDINKRNEVITKEIIAQYKDNILRRLLYDNEKG